MLGYNIPNANRMSTPTKPANDCESCVPHFTNLHRGWLEPQRTTRWVAGCKMHDSTDSASISAVKLWIVCPHVFTDQHRDWLRGTEMYRYATLDQRLQKLNKQENAWKFRKTRIVSVKIDPMPNKNDQERRTKYQLVGRHLLTASAADMPRASFEANCCMSIVIYASARTDSSVMINYHSILTCDLKTAWKNERAKLRYLERRSRIGAHRSRE